VTADIGVRRTKQAQVRRAALWFYEPPGNKKATLVLGRGQNQWPLRGQSVDTCLGLPCWMWPKGCANRSQFCSMVPMTALIALF